MLTTLKFNIIQRRSIKNCKFVWKLWVCHKSFNLRPAPGGQACCDPGWVSLAVMILSSEQWKWSYSIWILDAIFIVCKISKCIKVKHYKKYRLCLINPCSAHWFLMHVRTTAKPTQLYQENSARNGSNCCCVKYRDHIVWDFGLSMPMSNHV